MSSVMDRPRPATAETEELFRWSLGKTDEHMYRITKVCGVLRLEQAIWFKDSGVRCLEWRMCEVTPDMDVLMVGITRSQAANLRKQRFVDALLRQVLKVKNLWRSGLLIDEQLEVLCGFAKEDDPRLLEPDST